MDSGPLPLCRTAKMLLSARALNAIHDGNPGILPVSSQADTEESDLARECEELAFHAGGARRAVGALRVTFWGALAMALMYDVGALFGTVV